MKTKIRIFFLKFLCNCKNKLYFCITKTSLSYGVMVTQQILVLLFLVRIQVAQQNRSAFRGAVFVWYMSKEESWEGRCAPAVCPSGVPQRCAPAETVPVFGASFVLGKPAKSHADHWGGFWSSGASSRKLPTHKKQGRNGPLQRAVSSFRIRRAGRNSRPPFLLLLLVELHALDQCTRFGLVAAETHVELHGRLRTAL